MACDVVAVISGMAFEARMARGSGITTVYGLNRAQLTRDIEQAIQNGAKALLSFGVAAGLMPSLTAGTLVIAQAIRWQDQVFEAHPQWAAALQRQLPDALLGNIAGLDNPITTRSEKSSLYMQCDAAIADMESHVAARLAQRHNIAFAALRVILDDAECTLPPAALAATKADGSVDYIGLMRSVLTHPGQIPSLIELAAHQQKAKKMLLRCSKILQGSRFGFADFG